METAVEMETAAAMETLVETPAGTETRVETPADMETQVETPGGTETQVGTQAPPESETAVAEAMARAVVMAVPTIGDGSMESIRPENKPCP